MTLQNNENINVVFYYCADLVTKEVCLDKLYVDLTFFARGSWMEEFITRYSTFTDDEDIFTLRQLITDSPKIEIPRKVLFHLLFHRNGDNSSIFKYRKKTLLPKAESYEDAIQPVPEQIDEYDFEGELCAN